MDQEDQKHLYGPAGNRAVLEGCLGITPIALEPMSASFNAVWVTRKSPLHTTQLTSRRRKLLSFTEDVREIVLFCFPFFSFSLRERDRKQRIQQPTRVSSVV